MTNYIKPLLDTRGWKEAEKIIQQTITDLKNEEIDESLDAKEYKIVSLGKRDAVKHIQVLLNKIKNSGELTNKQISYK